MDNNKTRQRGPHAERGDISLIIALIMITIVTASAVVLGGTLSRQIRANRDVVVTERALYASNSGFEHALYLRLKKNQDIRSGNPVRGEIAYDDEIATYEGQAYLTPGNVICALGVGNFRNLVRKLAIGPADCTF